MKEYFNFVDNLAQLGEDKDFFNSGPIHAAIVMSRIFKYANNNINIFCGGFTGAVSNDPDYLKTLEAFLLKPQTTLAILVEDYQNNKDSSIYKILKKYNHKIELFETTARVINTDTNMPIHFTIADNKMVRLETNPEDFTAQVNFNAPNASTIKALFTELYKTPNNTKIIL
jgi:hypothetical protein